MKNLFKIVLVLFVSILTNLLNVETSFAGDPNSHPDPFLEAFPEFDIKSQILLTVSSSFDQGHQYDPEIFARYIWSDTFKRVMSDENILEDAEKEDLANLSKAIDQNDYVDVDSSNTEINLIICTLVACNVDRLLIDQGSDSMLVNISNLEKSDFTPKECLVNNIKFELIYQKKWK